MITSVQTDTLEQMSGLSKKQCMAMHQQKDVAHLKVMQEMGG
ncbi:MAG: hypothetical protein ACJAWS_003304 [Oleiphilaceae bacterium]